MAILTSYILNKINSIYYNYWASRCKSEPNDTYIQLYYTYQYGLLINLTSCSISSRHKYIWLPLFHSWPYSLMARSFKSDFFLWSSVRCNLIFPYAKCVPVNTFFFKMLNPFASKCILCESSKRLARGKVCSCLC